MQVSFFQNGSYILGIDYSYTPAIASIPPEFDEEGNIVKEGVLGVLEQGHPDCIFSVEIEFDPEKQVPVLIEKKGKYSVNLEDIPETPAQKHNRIYSSIVSAESLDDIDLKGETFSDFEIGEMITARVFGGNPHAEKALTNKALAIAITLLQGGEMTKEMQEKIALAQAKKAEVDAVRNLFSLGNL